MLENNFSRVFDVRRCKACGASYCLDEVKEVAKHKKCVEKLHKGFVSGRIPSDILIWEEPRFWITVVVHNDTVSVQRKRVERISKLGNGSINDFTYWYPESNKWDRKLNLHSFLLYTKNRLIGVITFAQRREISDEFENLIWVVEFLWVAKNHRREGYAKSLLSQSIHYLNVKMDDLQWSPMLSSEGKLFANSVTSGNLHRYGVRKPSI